MIICIQQRKVIISLLDTDFLILRGGEIIRFQLGFVMKDRIDIFCPWVYSV